MGAVYRHKVRGTFYEVVGTATLQIAGEHDDAPVVVYQGEHGELWVRPFAEFHDGRFELIEDDLSISNFRELLSVRTHAELREGLGLNPVTPA